MVWGHAAVCVCPQRLHSKLAADIPLLQWVVLPIALLYLDSYRLLAKLKASTVRADFGAHKRSTVPNPFRVFPGCPGCPLACHYFQLILTVVS